MGGSLSGRTMRLSAINVRKAASGGSAHPMKSSGFVRAARLTSARVPCARQIKSGSRPIIE
jgi:hypothetical protein